MKVTEPEESGRYTALYEATIRQAVGGASGLMARLVAQTRASLRALEERATERRERDALTHARRLLNQFEATLCERFAEELLTAFSRMASVERAVPAASQALHFDQLAAMDESLLQQSVETARVQQTVQTATDSALDELNRLICTMLGLAEVRLERNPLRPAVYVEALTAAVTHLPAPMAVRHHWMARMSDALARELNVYYQQLCTQLRTRGLDSAVVLRPVAAIHPALQPARRESSVLTLEKLRRLLADSPDAAHGDDALTQRFGAEEASHEAAPQHRLADSREAAPTAFRATVPAALDAIRDTEQLDQVVQRLEQRQAATAATAAAAAAPAAGTDALAQLRAKLRSSAHGLEQALGLEVVALMVDNITHDARLLGPVQRVVAALEPALLQLALVDPRFFSHKQHPARRLLHEITYRSIAFESVDSRGFSGFMEPLIEAVAPLSDAVVETAEPFDLVLGQLVGLWDEPVGQAARQVAKAVKALQTAEQRNALAATIVEAIQARPDAALVPDAVLDFLCGPWAQVVAHARISDKSGDDDPGRYAELIEGLMWSAQPHLTRKNVSALTRLVPKLLIRLRGGLATIDYPAHKTSSFFEVLMHLHQRGFKPDAELAAPPAMARPQDAAATPARAGAHAATWVAPLEARASGFIDLSTDLQPLPVAVPEQVAVELELDAWVALQAEGGWTRTRLTWISPNGTLMLFTDALGYMQTLTRRSCKQLFATGQLRVISAHLVEDALDAVAQAAMRNSVDVRF